jgi:hypothetical protein
VEFMVEFTSPYGVSKQNAAIIVMELITPSNKSPATQLNVC